MIHTRTGDSRVAKRRNNNLRVRDSVIFEGIQLQLVLFSEPWSIMFPRGKVFRNSRFRVRNELLHPRWSRDLRERQPGDKVHLCKAEPFALRAEEHVGISICENNGGLQCVL